MHIDGYPALVCHSLVVGATAEAPATGRAAALIQAAHLGAEAAIRLLREGNSSTDVRKVVLALCAEHGVEPIEGMMSHAVCRNNLAVDKTIIFRPSESQAKSDTAFEGYQVWAVDVAVSAGKGKTVSLAGHKTNVFGKNEGVTYSLKLKASRAVFSEIQAQSGSMAFHLRSLGDQVKSRMALGECVSHQLIQPYEVQGEKDAGDLTARFMFTAIIMPAGPLKLTDCAYDPALVRADVAVCDPDVKALLETPIRPAKAK